MKNLTISWVLVALLTAGFSSLGEMAMAAKQIKNEVVVHGHRGSRGTHPENTLPAFEEAVKAGVQVLELDLQLTQDDLPIVSHDPEIGKFCRDEKGILVKEPIPIRTLTYAQIQKYDCGSVQNPRFPEQKPLPGTRIPSLETFLVWAKKNAPDVEFNIETKMTAPRPEWVADPQLFAEKVVSTLRKHGAIEKTILQSFDFRTLRAAHVLEPRLRLSCLFENIPAFCDATVAENGLYASPNWESVTKEEVARCHKQGVKVVPWTANTEAAWNKMLEAGVDALITDYPRKLVKYLNAKNH